MSDLVVMASNILDQATRTESKITGGQQAIFEKNQAANTSDDSETQSVQRPEDEYQRGVRQARAITTVWNTQTLWLMFIL